MCQSHVCAYFPSKEWLYMFSISMLDWLAYATVVGQEAWSLPHSEPLCCTLGKPSQILTVTNSTCEELGMVEGLFAFEALEGRVFDHLFSWCGPPQNWSGKLENYNPKPICYLAIIKEANIHYIVYGQSVWCHVWSSLFIYVKYHYFQTQCHPGFWKPSANK